jgi:hypothetical protein
MSSVPLTPLFFYKPSIESDSGEADRKLVLEIGEQHLAITISDASGKNIYYFSFFNIETDCSPIDILSIVKSTLESDVTFTDIILINNRNQYVLLPEHIYKEHATQNVLEAIHGDLIKSTVQSDHIHQWEIAAIHGVESELMDLLQHHFPQLRIIHFISPALRHAFRNMNTEAKQSLKLLFYPGYFIAQFFTADQLQLVQHFYYETSEDVLYHVLNIGEKYHLDVTEVQIGVSGIIDKQGDIWRELNRHFLHVSIDECIPLANSDSNFPTHYFTPFFMVPTCV